MSEPSDTTTGAQATKESSKPADEREAIKAQLQTTEQARDEYLAQAKRARADFENYQKRAARDQAQEKKYAVAALAADLLAALDRLERATAAAEQAGWKRALVHAAAVPPTRPLAATPRARV